MYRRRLPSLTSLRNFEAVARHRSFTRAADELCVTQGAVSHQIKILEEDLEAKLLIRGRQGVELTEFGSMLMAASTAAFDSLAEIVLDIRQQAAAVRRQLRIYVSPQFCHFWLAQRIIKFSEDNRDIEIHLSARSAEAMPDMDDKSLMILPFGLDHPYEFGDRLFSSDLMPLCNPDLKQKFSDSQFLNSTTILCEADHDWWGEWCRVAGDGFSLSSKRLYFDDPATMVHAASAGSGVMMGSPQLLWRQVSEGRLAPAVDPSLSISRSYHLVYSEKGAGTQPVKQFREWLLGEIAADPHL